MHSLVKVRKEIKNIYKQLEQDSDDRLYLEDIARRIKAHVNSATTLYADAFKVFGDEEFSVWTLNQIDLPFSVSMTVTYIPQRRLYEYNLKQNTISNVYSWEEFEQPLKTDAEIRDMVVRVYKTHFLKNIGSLK